MKDVDKPEGVQRKATKMIRGSGKQLKGKSKEMGLLSLEKEKKNEGKFAKILRECLY